jgi:hypothetical protein
VVKDRRLRDNLPVSEDDHPHVQAMGQRQTFTANQPELREVLRRWRRAAQDRDPPRLLLGETYVLPGGGVRRQRWPSISPSPPPAARRLRAGSSWA